jgi:hypothetical protein
LNAFLAFDMNHRMNPFSLEGMTRLSEMREQKSFPEARRLLSLLPIAPRGDVGLYWNEFKAFLAALITVLAHHLNDPEAAPLKPSDMCIYQDLIVDLGKLVEKSGNVVIAQERELCITLFSRLQTKPYASPLQSRVIQGEYHRIER